MPHARHVLLAPPVSPRPLSATQFIYRAALATGWPAPEAHEVPDDTCWLCSGPTEGRGKLASEVLSHTFNDSNLAHGPGRSLCQACLFCLQERVRAGTGESAKLTPEERAARRQAMKDPATAPGGVLGLRMFSFLATSERLLLPDRSEWRDLLLNPPEPPWVGAIAISGQKHLAIRAQVNHSNQAPVVLLEILPVRYSPSRLASDLAVIEDALAVFSKGELESGRYRQDRISRYGIGRFAGLEDRLEAMRLRRREFDLALHVARIPERDLDARPAKGSRVAKAPPTDRAKEDWSGGLF